MKNIIPINPNSKEINMQILFKLSVTLEHLFRIEERHKVDGQSYVGLIHCITIRISNYVRKESPSRIGYPQSLLYSGGITT